MAQESNTEAPVAASVATFRQRTREGATSFALFPDRLDYTFLSRHGTRVERHIAWNIVPSLSRLRRNAHPDRRTNILMRVSLMVLIFFLLAHLAVPTSPLLMIVGLFAIIWSLTILLTRRFRVHNSLLPTSEGNIVVLGDAAHDAVVARLMDARRAYFRRFATIDKQRTVRWNLQRLRWLFGQELIGRDEFMRLQRSLLPSVPEPMLRPPAETGPDLKIEQRYCNALFSFDFGADRLAYRRRTGNGVETQLSVGYLELPEPTTEVQVGRPSELLSYLTIWLVLIGFGYGLEVLRHLPRWYFSGPDGLERGLILYGPAIVAVVLAIVIARRFMRTVCTKLPSDILVLKNRQHDAILAELKRRRLAALKAMVEPDPLLSPSEQANLLQALRERGIVDAQQIPDILARAAALQRHLGLDDPEPRDEAPTPGEQSAAPTAPRPTIH